MDITLYDIVNQIKDAKNLRYLELGVGDGSNFAQTICDYKVSVDAYKGKNAVTNMCTTDDFFSQIPDDLFFDIIFIDACHHYEYVLRDFNNSIKHSSKWIVMHDMIPPTEAHTTRGRCSDGYKLLHHMIEKTNMQIYPMKDPDRLGLTFIKMPGTTIKPAADNRGITYQQFIDWIHSKKLYRKEEILQILND